MALRRMDIQTIVVGNGPISSLIVLRTQATSESEAVQLPIRIGRVEAAAISMGVGRRQDGRPMTHDLLRDTIVKLGAGLLSVAIVDVRGTTFFARLNLETNDGRHLSLDCRPSDAIALAVRMHVPILADDRVLDTATMPDFKSVEEEEKGRELERFHEFVESLSPEDFAPSE